MAIIKRLVKGLALTHAELDNNFTELEAADAGLDTRVGVLEAAAGTVYTHGFEDYNHAGASQALVSGTPVKILNDGLGAFTNKAYKIPGRGDIWDTSTNQFKWADAGLALGDVVFVRFDLDITSSGANDGFSIDVDVGVGSGGAYTLNSDYREYRTAGTYNWKAEIEIYMGDTNTLNFPAEVTITADSGSDSVQYNGHYVRYTPRTPTAT